MFYDERIENIKGRIAKNALVISLFVSLLLGGVHLANLIRNAPTLTYLSFAAADVAIFIGTLVALTVGVIRHRRHPMDERAAAEQSRFYGKAAAILIKCSLGVFSLALPIALYIGRSHSFADAGVDGLLYVLLFAVGIYVVYGFRKNDIYFNYSIMDQERYGWSVLKNIGRLSLYVLVYFGMSVLMLSWITVWQDLDAALYVKLFLQVLVYAIGALIELSAIYFLYSVLERSSYQSEGSISKATVVSLWITILIYGIYAAGVLYVNAQPISRAFAAQLASLLSSLDIYIKFALLMFLTYFGYEYQKNRKSKWLSIACVTILLSEVLSVLVGRMADGLIFVYIPEILHQQAHVINQLLSTVTTLIEDVSSLASAVGLVLIVFALIKDKAVCVWHRLIVPALALLGGVEIFLRTQLEALHVNIYHTVAEIAVLCYLAVLVALAGRSLNTDQVGRA